jgi:Thiolase, C-terminal domain
MGVGPAYAIPVALRNAGLTLKDIDVFEINEVRSPSLQSLSHLNFTLRSIIFLSISPSLIRFFILPISLIFFILSLSPVSFTSPHALPIMYHSLPPSLDFLSPLSSLSHLSFRLLPCHLQAFASQCLYCVRHLGIPIEKVNPYGGAIAVGHPLGCSGKSSDHT